MHKAGLKHLAANKLEENSVFGSTKVSTTKNN